MAASSGSGLPTDLAAAVELARGGDEDAIRVLYRWLNPPLIRYLRYASGSMAEDLASEVWLGVARLLPSFGGGPHELRALVFTIARRRVVDLRRHRARRVVTLPIEEGDELATGDVTEEAALARLGGQRAVDMLVRDLPPEQAEIVLLRVLGDLSVDEVATLLRKSPGAVRVAQHRALRRLGARLEQTTTTRGVTR